MEQQITKTDIIVRAFGISNLEIQRLVELDNKIRTSAALAGTEVEDQPMYGVRTEELIEWKFLMDKYYDNAVEILKGKAKTEN